MNTITTIDECLEAIEEIRSFLRTIRGLEPTTLPFTQARPETQSNDEYLEKFTDLRSLLNSVRWPYAIEPQYICSTTSEGDKTNRADGILDSLVNKSLKNSKFLDFGCGEGHVVEMALKREVRKAIGYDIESFGTPPWKNNPDNFVTNIEDLKDEKFDVIVISDVLDHVINEDPVEVLKRAKSLLAPWGEISIRFHPWISRHGGHLYNQKNRAFVHLVFSEEELYKLGMTPVKTQKVIDPERTYSDWIRLADLNVVKKEITSNRVEDFFLETDLVRANLNKMLGRQDSYDIPAAWMEQSFLDYILKA